MLKLHRGQRILILVFTHTPMCVSTVYTHDFPESCEKNKQIKKFVRQCSRIARVMCSICLWYLFHKKVLSIYSAIFALLFISFAFHFVTTTVQRYLRPKTCVLWCLEVTLINPWSGSSWIVTPIYLRCCKRPIQGIRLGLLNDVSKSLLL